MAQATSSSKRRVTDMADKLNMMNPFAWASDAPDSLGGQQHQSGKPVESEANPTPKIAIMI
jgi:hypothetical protein